MSLKSLPQTAVVVDWKSTLISAVLVYSVMIGKQAAIHLWRLISPTHCPPIVYGQHKHSFENINEGESIKRLLWAIMFFYLWANYEGQEKQRISKKENCILFVGKWHCMLFVRRNNIHPVIATVLLFWLQGSTEYLVLTKQHPCFVPLEDFTKIYRLFRGKQTPLGMCSLIFEI